MLPPNKFIDINKTYQRLQGKDVITTPKTRKSKRKVPIPDFLCDELREFISTRYMITPDERLFPITKSYLSHEMIRGCKNTGVKNIRIHDIRHPYVKPTTKKFITFFEVFRAASWLPIAVSNGCSRLYLLFGFLSF